MSHRARIGVVLIGFTLAACATVPYTGREQLVLLPESAEIELGLSAYRQILSTARISRDPAANAAVTRVGRRIAAATGKDYQWRFTVVESAQVNAFCLPGGKVVVYTGILPVAHDDKGLATVLGHEIAHAVARHGAERVSQGLLVESGLVAVQAAMSRNDPTTVRTVTALLGAGATVGLVLPWSRTQESEADHLGLIFMAKAGYDPRAAIAFWQRMLEASRGQPRPPAFLSDHPADETRIRRIEAWIPEVLPYYRPG